ncbi:MAG: hypothetical protein ACP5MV_04100 [Candidatus Parvarchaeum sp.]
MKKYGLLILVIIVIFILAALYMHFHFNEPANKSFNLDGIYFQYPLNWTLVKYHYNPASNQTFSALLMPTYLVNSLVYSNGSLISTPNVTTFSEISITILSNISMISLSRLFIFNESYVLNNITLAGFPGVEGIEYINGSLSIPPSKSITYISDGNNIGYSLGAFYSNNLNKTTYSAIDYILKTLKYTP